jgi:hypothetical protein
MTVSTARPGGAALGTPTDALLHPRRQRAGPQPGEVRVRHRPARLFRPPHLRRRRRPSPGQC